MSIVGWGVDILRQKGANNLARDETYHPFTRTDLKLPDAESATPMDYKELIEETPLFTLFKMVIRQFLYVLGVDSVASKSC